MRTVKKKKQNYGTRNDKNTLIKSQIIKNNVKNKAYCMWMKIEKIMQ